VESNLNNNNQPTKETIMFRTAPAPTRANSSFMLSLGLVNIPLSILTGMEATKVARNEFVDGDTDRPIGRQPYDKVTGQAVDQSVIVRMAQATNGAYVILTDDEIAQATMPKGVADVVAFVPVKDVRTAYVTEKVDQVRARTSGLKGAQIVAAERAFGLFLAGLKARKVVALIKVALRGPARFAAITPDGDLLMLHPVDAIRQPKELPAHQYSEKELGLMNQLIESYPQGTPMITDDTASAIQAYIDIKATGAGPAPLAEPNLDGADDLFASLMASVDARKGA
jgi:non-homologous end joining protein Ku